MSVDIAYVVSHGFAARMLTQTDLLGKLAIRGNRVALICPDKNDELLSSYCAKNGIQLVEFVAKKGFGDENYMYKRKYYLEDIEANPALLDKHIHAVRYNRSRHPIRLIRPYYYWLIYRLIKHFPGIRKRFKGNEKANLKSVEAENLINWLNPKKLVSTYPVNYNEAVLLHYGNTHPNVQTWIHLLSWDNITCKGRFPETADKYIAWGNVMKAELMEYYGVSAENIHVCGVPHFDVHVNVRFTNRFRAFLQDISLNPQLPYLFFAMSSPRFAPHEIDIVEWLAQQISEGAFGELQLVVRPHPQNIEGNMLDKTWLPRLQKLSLLKHVAVDYPTLIKSKMKWSMEQTDMERLAHLLEGASIVLNSGSTVSIDALVHGKPVMITSFDGNESLDYWKSARRLIDYIHLKKLVSYGGIDVVNSFAEMTDKIRRYLMDPEHKTKEREITIKEEIFQSDGQATERVCQALAGFYN